MGKNVAPTIGGAGNREEQQIQTINIDTRKANNSTVNSSKYITSSFLKKTVFLVYVVPVILFYHCPCL